MRQLFEGLGFIVMAGGLALGPVAVLIAALRFHARRQERRYRFLLDLADRQQPLPPELLVERSPAESDRRRGIVLVGGALGLWMMLQALPMTYGAADHRVAELWGLACLPLMVGLGYLLNWWMARKDG